MNDVALELVIAGGGMLKKAGNFDIRIIFSHLKTRIKYFNTDQIQAIQCSPKSTRQSHYVNLSVWSLSKFFMSKSSIVVVEHRL